MKDKETLSQNMYHNSWSTLNKRCQGSVENLLSISWVVIEGCKLLKTLVWSIKHWSKSYQILQFFVHWTASWTCNFELLMTYYKFKKDYIFMDIFNQNLTKIFQCLEKVNSNPLCYKVAINVNNSISTILLHWFLCS